jgi:hypothetical protein
LTGRHLGFEIGDVLQAGDELSEWIATIAIAVNDCSFASGLVLGETQPGEWIYALRLSVSHFTEAGKYLELTDSLPAVQAFLGRLTKGANEYAQMLGTYRRHKAQLHSIRDNAAFHYPAWQDTSKRTMKRALDAAAGSLGLVRLDHPDAANRLLFADEIVSAIVTRAAGGQAELQAMLIEVSEAINAFAVFGDAAVDRYLVDKCGQATEYELVDPNDYSLGWKPVGN